MRRRVCVRRPVCRDEIETAKTLSVGLLSMGGKRRDGHVPRRQPVPFGPGFRSRRNQRTTARLECAASVWPNGAPVPAWEGPTGRKDKAARCPRKRKRSQLGPEQVGTLMDVFCRQPLPDTNTRLALARQLGMTPRSVQVWFQNMRAKAKRKRVAAATHGRSEAPRSTSPSPSSKRQMTHARCHGMQTPPPVPPGSGEQPTADGKRDDVVGSPTDPMRDACGEAQSGATPGRVPAGPTSTANSIRCPAPGFFVQLHAIPRSIECDQIRRATERLADGACAPTVKHSHQGFRICMCLDPLLPVPVGERR